MDDLKKIEINLFQLSATRLFASSADCRGFTLVELIVVAAVLGVLASMALPFYSGYIKSVRNSACVADLRSIDKAILAYVTSNNALPASLNDVGMGSTVDPWQRPFAYKILSNGDPLALEDIAFHPLNTDYDLYSTGPDGVSLPATGDPGNTDDIVRSNDGAYVGVRP